VSARGEHRGARTGQASTEQPPSQTSSKSPHCNPLSLVFEGLLSTNRCPLSAALSRGCAWCTRQGFSTPGSVSKTHLNKLPAPLWELQLLSRKRWPTHNEPQHPCLYAISPQQSYCIAARLHPANIPASISCDCNRCAHRVSALSAAVTRAQAPSKLPRNRPECADLGDATALNTTPTPTPTPTVACAG
jgi:hypothetical protein